MPDEHKTTVAAFFAGHMAEGAAARRAGDGASECPYPLHSTQRFAWVEGWLGWEIAE